MKPPVLAVLLIAALLLPSASKAATFQAVEFIGDLAVVDTTHLLSTATFIKPDPGFKNATVMTGLSRNPADGSLWIAGIDFVNSFVGEVDWTTGAVTTLVTLNGEVVVDLAFDGAGSLYALSANGSGSHPHSLLKIDTGTGTLSVAKVLNAHGGTSDFGQVGVIGWNPSDQSLYYADLDSSSHLFIDKLSDPTFTQSPVFATSLSFSPPLALSFTGGRLFLSTSSGVIYSADATNVAGGLTQEGQPGYPTADGDIVFSVSGMVPAALGCTPSPTAACLYNRFKVEVAYDATPQNGSGSGRVVLESGKSVKWTFFDPENIELIVKVLDACSPPFNKWWVFGGGLTNVGVLVTVTDTKTGAQKTYSNPKGTLFKPFADTAAFTCP